MKNRVTLAILVFLALNFFFSDMAQSCPQRSKYREYYGESALPSQSSDPRDYVLLRYVVKFKIRENGSLDPLSRATRDFLLYDHCASEEFVTTEARRAFELHRTIQHDPALGKNLPDTIDGKRVTSGREVEYEWYTSLLAREADAFVEAAFTGLQTLSEKDHASRLDKGSFGSLKDYNEVRITKLPLGDLHEEAHFDLKVTVKERTGSRSFLLPNIPIFEVVDPTDSNRPEKLQPLLACGAEYFLERIMETRRCQLSDEDCEWIRTSLKNPRFEVQNAMEISVRFPKNELPNRLNDSNVRRFRKIELTHEEDDCPSDIRDAR